MMVYWYMIHCLGRPQTLTLLLPWPCQGDSLFAPGLLLSNTARSRLGAQSRALLLPCRYQVVNAALVVLWLAHVREPGSPGSLRPSPDNVDGCNRRAVDFEPRLNARLHHLAAQQNGCVRTTSTDFDQVTRERLSIFGADH